MSRLSAPSAALFLCLSLSAHAGNPGNGGPNNGIAQHSVNGMVNGLSAGGLVLQLGSETLAIAASGPFAFTSTLREHASYSVTVASQPGGQACTVANGSGVLQGHDVRDVSVTCAAIPTWAIHAVIDGLSGTLGLSLNGGATESTSANGFFTFAKRLTDGSPYAITIASPPAGQDCGITGSPGAVAGSDAVVTVHCFALAIYSVSAVIDGLSGTLGLSLNGGALQSTSSNGVFVFPGLFATGAPYAVTATPPAGQNCTVSGSPGTISGANATVTVHCFDLAIYTVDAIVDGLSGTVGLSLNGAAKQNVSSNGVFVFPGTLANGAPYAVTVSSRPLGQDCTVSGSPGTIAGADATVTVHCFDFAFLHTGQSPVRVLGQPDFTTCAAGALTASQFNRPSATAFAGDKLFVADSVLNRVLGFDGIPAVNLPVASLVLGQTNFGTATAGSGFNQMNFPFGLAAEGTHLAVADSQNSRVLLFSPIPSFNGPAASGAVGVTGSSTCSASSLVQPLGVAMGGGKLVVADSGGNRVMIWGSLNPPIGVSPDVVIGQPTSFACTAALSQNRLDFPTGVWTDGTRLAVADYNNNRVLIWNHIPTSSGANADLVLGQSNFISSVTTPLSPTSFRPFGVSSNGTQLVVTDPDNSRVLVWNTFPTSMNAAADLVIGQASFGASGSSCTPTSLNGPTDARLVPGGLVVTDSNNNRVLIYDTSTP